MDSISFLQTVAKIERTKFTNLLATFGYIAKKKKISIRVATPLAI